MIVIWSRLEGKKVCNCTRCASCVRRLMFRIILCITQLIALWYPLVYLKISAPLIPMCPLSQCARCLYGHILNQFFSSLVFFYQRLWLLLSFHCSMLWIQRNRAEQSKERERERDHHVQPWSFANRSSILLSDPCTLRCGGMIEISFFHLRLLCFPRFLFGVLFCEINTKHKITERCWEKKPNEKLGNWINM